MQPIGPFITEKNDTGAGIAALAATVAVVALGAGGPAAADPAPAPRLLSETGLYAEGSRVATGPGVISFTPQYSLWSDGTSKRRWIYLPPGSHIDGSRPDAWEFPVGTKLWKEFSYGQRVETRLIERLHDGAWRFTAYVWRADGSDAEIAPPAGIRALPIKDAPNKKYVVPSQDDCRACHEGGAVPVLGFGALQLSPDRDPKAPHAEPRGALDVDLRALVQRGLLRNLPRELLDRPPRIQTASTVERAALGYLHANCGHCHNDPRESEAGVPVELLLAQYVARRDSAAAARRSVAGLVDPAALTRRMRVRDPQTQMPPLGTQVPDAVGLALIERWINQELKSKEHTP